MMHVKLIADLEDVARRAADRWYVSTGNVAVGPVNLDLIARGVEAGKVPIADAFVRHEQWRVWRPLRELVERDTTDDIADVGRPSTPEDFAPGDAIDGAADRHDALVLLMTAAVARASAEAVIVHEIERVGARVACAHGTNVTAVLGAHTSLADPAVIAASAGRIETDAEASLTRLSTIAEPIGSSVTLPILPHGALVAMIEIGRATPFRREEIASLLALVDALVERLERWSVSPV
jgi:hypothetical protein